MSWDEVRCTPFWTGTQWWCPHGRELDTDLTALEHYLTGMEKMLDYLGVSD